MKPQVHELVGKEKAKYLKQIDTCLKTLSSNITVETKMSGSAKDFGKKNGWNLTRIPENKELPETLSYLINLIAEEYKFFDWTTSLENPGDNRGYFETIGISSESGLQWVFSFMERDRLKKEAVALLKNMKTYEENVESLVELLMKDYAEINDVYSKSNELNIASMKRNYL
ncbi:hypothetical protein HYX19_01455, partial [Candidatus Woesearchaeota archaeon]|nr:hypothetical protein [Candidatus Woesearchaeota archaeon]